MTMYETDDVSDFGPGGLLDGGSDVPEDEQLDDAAPEEAEPDEFDVDLGAFLRIDPRTFDARAWLLASTLAPEAMRTKVYKQLTREQREEVRAESSKMVTAPRLNHRERRTPKTNAQKKSEGKRVETFDKPMLVTQAEFLSWDMNTRQRFMKQHRDAFEALKEAKK